MKPSHPAEEPAAPTRPPRRLVVLCVVAVLVATCILHREVLFGGMVYHMDDAADNYYPSRVVVWRALKAGELPTWERGSWTGWPLISDPYYGIFYPPTVLFYAVGLVRGLGFTIALHVLWGALGMFWLLRRRRLDLGPALLGAASLAFSSFMVARIRHVIFAEMMAWLPFVLVGVEGYLSTRRARELVLCAVGTGMALVCGALPLLPFFGLLVVAYLLPRLLREERRLRALAALGAAGGVGLLLAMPQIIPTLAHLPSSPRAFGADYVFASSYAWPDLRYLATLLVPDLFGRELRSEWYGAFNHWEMAGYYAGALVTVLAPLALGRRRRPELGGLLCVTLIGIALAFGDGGPLHAWAFRHVPLYAALRCPTRALVMWLGAAPILGAEGLAWLLGRRSRPRPHLGLVVGLLFFAAGGAAVWALVHGDARLAPSALMQRWAFAHTVGVLAAGGGALALGLLGRVPRRATGLALGLITLVELVVLGRGHVQPRPGDWAEGTERFAAVDWLLAQHPSDRFVPEATGPFRLHNLGMTYGVESAAGYGSIEIWRYLNFIHVLNTGAPYPHRPVRHDFAATDVRRFDTPLVDLLNLRWAIATRPPAPDWVERFRPTPGAPSRARHETAWDAQLRVYENPHPLPRAFVVYGARVLPDEEAQARALSTLDPRATVILDRAPDPAPVGDGRPHSPARLVVAERHRLVIEAEATAPGVLVVSEAAYPGWTATLDGAPVPILLADLAFRGVAVPAGRHRVELRYRSRATELGIALGLVGLLGIVGLCLGGRLRRKGAIIGSHGTPVHLPGTARSLVDRRQGQPGG